MILDMWRKERFFSLFVSSLLVLSILTGVVGSLGDQDERIVLVITEKESELNRLKDLDIDIIDSYGCYNLIKANQKKIELLEDNEFKIDILKVRNTLHINGERYDIKKDLESYVISDFDNKMDSRLFLIHMIGPVNPEWRTRLERSGIEILNYFSNYVYLVKGDNRQMDRVKDLFFIDNILHYNSKFKMADDLEKGMVRINFLDESIEISNLKDRGVNILSRSNNIRGCEITANIYDKDFLKRIAERNDVYSITKVGANELKSELQSQVVGGYWSSTTPSTPYRGEGDYGAYVNQIGFTGKNVTLGFADTGLGNGEVGDAGHNDFTDRVIGGYSYGFTSDWSDGYGHGTHVTGIASGDTYHGNNLTYEGHGPYYLSQGLAYDSNIFAQKIFSDNGAWIGPQDGIYSILENAKRQGDVYIHSNSWGEDVGDGIYDYRDSDYDKGVRDSDSETTGNQPMIVVVSAGNEGDNGFGNIASPGNGKNVITVGATRNYMPDAGNYGYASTGPADPYEIFYKSSKGWTEDNRVKPTVVAPGEAILSTSTTELSSSNLHGIYSEDPRYEWSTGTSQSTPAGTGASAVIVEYYKEKYGVKPSPAMVKSLMINAAEPIDYNDDGTIESIPNKYVGWGNINLVPICDPDVKVMNIDQKSLLETGQTDTYDIAYYDSNKPMKITLTWTDKEAGSGDNPALKNDLDLEITAPNGDVYRGNAFVNGYTPSGANTMSDFDLDDDGDDDTNVVENIFIPSGELQTGTYSVRIIGENVPADANNDGLANQDYALTMYNANNLSADGIVNIEKDIYSENDTVNITVEDLDLKSDTVPVNISSTTEPTEKTVYLDKESQGIYKGSIKISGRPDKGDLLVSDGDEIVVSYYDENTSSGDSEIKKATAFVDGSPPDIIEKIIDSKLSSRLVIKTDESCTMSLNYGKNQSLGNKIVSNELIANHTFVIENLTPGNEYFYEIICEDQVGNELVDNNNGKYYELKANTLDDFDEGNIGWNSTSKWKLKNLFNDTSNKSWVCGDGDYGTGWYEVLTSTSVHIDDWDRIRLSVFHKYELDKNRDGGIVQVKSSNGWKTVEPQKGYDGIIETDYGNELGGNSAFTGEQNWTWKDFYLDNTSFNETFRFRFIMGTDYIDNNDFGWIIDQVKLNGSLSPVANFTYEPISPYTSEKVNFTDQSYDLDGRIVNWTWEFGDGNLSYDSNPNHSYSDNGEYNVSLEITDDFGIKESISRYVIVNNEPPTANFTINQTDIRSGDLIKFTDKSYDPDGRIVNWTWDFGDGNTSYDENPTHRYMSDDNYLVRLSVEDDDGMKAYKMKNIKVENAFPTSRFNYSPLEDITTEDTVQFKDLSEDIDGHIVNWTWNFGDGYISYLKDPTHRYTDNGHYNVSLRVIDDDGAENVSVNHIYVKNIKPSADFIFEPSNPSTGNIVQFSDRSKDIDGTIMEWQWYFGDGTSSSLKDPEHIYSDDGSYSVKLTVKDTDGAESTVEKTITVTNRPPEVNFTYSYKGDKTSIVVYFNSDSTDPDGSIENWTWYFSDGTVKYGENIKHKFDNSGQYNVRLFVTDDDGESLSVEKTVKIEEEKLTTLDVLSWALIPLSIIFIGIGIWVLKDEMKRS